MLISISHDTHCAALEGCIEGVTSNARALSEWCTMESDFAIEKYETSMRHPSRCVMEKERERERERER